MKLKRRRDKRIEIVKLAEDWRKFQGEKRKRWRRWGGARQSPEMPLHNRGR